MASKGTDQVEGPRCFQELEDAETLDYPVKSIPLEKGSLPSHQADTRAKNQAQSTRAQNKNQNTRAQNKAQSTRAQNKAQGTRAQKQSPHTQAKHGLRAQHVPQNPQGQEADKDGCSTDVSYRGNIYKIINQRKINHVCKRLSKLTKINFKSVKRCSMY